MIFSQVLIVLAVLPMVTYCYKCHLEDTSSYVQYSECTTNTFCTITKAYDNNNQEQYHKKGCDDGVCTTNGDYNTVKDSLGRWSNIYCCTGDFCNGATNKGFIAVPLMMVTYFLIK